MKMLERIVLPGTSLRCRLCRWWGDLPLTVQLEFEDGNRVGTHHFVCDIALKVSYVGDDSFVAAGLRWARQGRHQMAAAGSVMHGTLTIRCGRGSRRLQFRDEDGRDWHALV